MLNATQTRFAKLVSELINCDPFLPLRIELERKALGKEFDETNANWNLHPSQHRETENLQRLYDRALGILEAVVGKLDSVSADADSTELYLDLVSFVVFHDFRDSFEQMVLDDGKSASKTYQRFYKQWTRFCPVDRFPDSVTDRVPHIFAVLFQIRRAFNNIFRNIIGSSPPVIELRAEVWHSIFTHDLRRYYASMHRAISDFPTLITGPTGSGKELVAQAIGLSGYVPFSTESMKFASPISKLFTSLNLSALSPTLIESELFGHTKGAFTGAMSDRVGWLENCPKHGAVFLDEIGELDPEIQVKLLRVFEDRVFQRLGETTPRPFAGRIVAATNRDLTTEIKNGRFRMDFYSGFVQTESKHHHWHNAAPMTRVN